MSSGSIKTERVSVDETCRWYNMRCRVHVYLEAAWPILALNTFLEISETYQESNSAAWQLRRRCSWHQLRTKLTGCWKLSTCADALPPIVETWHPLSDACLLNKIVTDRDAYAAPKNWFIIGNTWSVVHNIPCQQDCFCFLTINRVHHNGWAPTKRICSSLSLPLRTYTHHQFIH